MNKDEIRYIFIIIFLLSITVITSLTITSFYGLNKKAWVVKAITVIVGLLVSGLFFLTKNMLTKNNKK